MFKRKVKFVKTLDARNCGAIYVNFYFEYGKQLLRITCNRQ